MFDPATATSPAFSTPGFPDHPAGHSCVSSAILNVMRDFFGSAAGIAYTLGVLAVWIVLPVAAATRWFGRKDL